MYNKLKTVLITGASRGIGKAIAQALVQEGYKVTGTSRHPEVLSGENKVEGVEYLPLDLLDEKSIQALINRVGEVDVLINNAGISQIGPVEEVPYEKVKELFELNLFGSIRLIQGFVPGMRKRRKGIIINISSIGGKLAVPFSGIFAATKHALEGLSWSLKNELHRFGVNVTLIEPNYVRTTIPQIKTHNEQSDYIEDINRVKTIRDAHMEQGAKPEVVAAKIIRILKMKNPAPSYAVGGGASFISFLHKILPDRWTIKLIRKNFKLNHS